MARQSAGRVDQRDDSGGSTARAPPPPPAPVVDLATGKCKPGKVSRKVSTSPLMLDLTVMCTPGVEVLQPGASTQVVLPLYRGQYSDCC